MSTKIPPLTLMYSIGGGGRVPARDAREVRLTYLPFRDRLLHGSMRRIEPAVEPDHEGHSRLLDSNERAVDFGKIQTHRLFAEDGLACARGTLNEVDMGIGARAHRDCVYLG